MPPMSLSSVLLPEPLWPMRPTVVPASIVEVDVLAAPRSPRGAGRARPKLTTRSLSDLSLRMPNCLDERSRTWTTVTSLVRRSSQLLREVALRAA